VEMQSDTPSVQAGKLLVRSIALPVQECTSMPWKEFCKLLHASWRQSTDLSNWASQQLARHDVTRTPGMKQLPPMQSLDLYALAFGRAKIGKPRTAGKDPLPIVAAQYDGGEFWAGAKIAAASLLRKVDRKYRKERGKIVWRRERRTPEYQYPVPFPVHQQAWTHYFGENGRPFVVLALPGGRVTIRLRNGPEFAPALKVLQAIEEGEFGRQELIITRQRSHCNDRMDMQRLPGGGVRETYRIMVRIAYSREVYAGTDGAVCEANTGKEPFLTLNDGQVGWVLHAPWVQQWIVAHRRFLDKFADDLKYEKRWPAGQRRRMNRRRERGCDKQNDRLKTFVQQTAAQVVGWAARRKCGTLMWNDIDRSFVESFPWHMLRSSLESKCDESGLAFRLASGAVVESDDPEILDAKEELD
jgi:hypothetical protein